MGVSLSLHSGLIYLFLCFSFFFFFFLLPSFISSSPTTPLAVYEDADSSRSVSCRYPSPSLQLSSLFHLPFAASLSITHLSFFTHDSFFSFQDEN